MNPVTAIIKKDHYKTQLAAGQNNLTSDEPEEHGGNSLGFSPGELLMASLGSCTAITLRMYADRKGWPLDEVHCKLTYEYDQEKNHTYIMKHIELLGPLSEDEKKRLLIIADRCPTHKILSNPISIETRIMS